MKRFLNLAIAITLFLFSLEREVYGAEIYTWGKAFRSIVIEGTIEHGDLDLFRDLIKSHYPNITDVVICSPGGDFYEAMKIGRLIRDLELRTVIPASDGTLNILIKKYWHLADPKNLTCASAAFFIHAGGVIRDGDSIFVHRPYIRREYLSEMSKEDAEKAFAMLQRDAIEYMNEMDVPKTFQEDTLNTPSDTAKQISREDINSLFTGFIPKYREWIKSKVDDLTQNERQRLQTLKTIRQHSPAETEEFRSLAKREYAAYSEMSKLHSSMTIDAYKKVFGEPPNDYRYHKFKTWTSAVRYLGESLSEIIAEERFEPIEVGKDQNYPTYETRKLPTGNSPLIQVLGMSRNLAGYVAISQSNPSKEFTEALIREIVAAWGKPDHERENHYWHWEKASFTASLHLHDAGASESSVDLSILALGKQFGTRGTK